MPMPGNVRMKFDVTESSDGTIRIRETWGGHAVATMMPAREVLLPAPPQQRPHAEVFVDFATHALAFTGPPADAVRVLRELGEAFIEVSKKVKPGGMNG